MLNPMNDDLGSSWTKSRREPRQDEDAATSYTEQDETLWRIEAIWGKQEPTPRPRRERKTNG